MTVGDIEIHLQGLSFNAIECDEVGMAHVSFVPIKPALSLYWCAACLRSAYWRERRRKGKIRIRQIRHSVGWPVGTQQAMALFVHQIFRIAPT